MNTREDLIQEIEKLNRDIVNLRNKKFLEYKDISYYIFQTKGLTTGYSPNSLSNLRNKTMIEKKDEGKLYAHLAKVRVVFEAIKELPSHWKPEPEIKKQKRIHKRIRKFLNTNWFIYHIGLEDSGEKHFARAVLTIGDDPKSVNLRSKRNEYFGSVQLLSESRYSSYINFVMGRDEEVFEPGLNIVGFIGRDRVPPLILGTYQNVTHADKLISGRLIFLKKHEVKTSDILFFTEENRERLNEVETEIKEYFEIYKGNLEFTVPSSVDTLYELSTHVQMKKLDLNK